MDISPNARVRKIAAPCRWCGRDFFAGKRAGRRRIFCSSACRQASFRNGDLGGHCPTARYGIVPKPSTNSAASKVENADRAFPVDLIGGGSFRWPGAGRIDAELRRLIINMEIGK